MGVRGEERGDGFNCSTTRPIMGTRESLTMVVISSEVCEWNA